MQEGRGKQAQYVLRLTREIPGSMEPPEVKLAAWLNQQHAEGYRLLTCLPLSNGSVFAIMELPEIPEAVLHYGSAQFEAGKADGIRAAYSLLDEAGFPESGPMDDFTSAMIHYGTLLDEQQQAATARQRRLESMIQIPRIDAVGTGETPQPPERVREG